MADIRAAQSGDFSATTTWVGGVVPGSGDVAFSNTFTITISDTRTVQAISNAAGTGITVGGTFSLLNGCNLTCTNANGVVQGNTTTSCVTTPSLTLGSIAAISANILHTSTTNISTTLSFTTAGTVNLTGNVSGPSAGASSSQAIGVSGTGILNHTGNLTGGTQNAAFAIAVTGNASVSITGNLTGGTGNATGYALSMNNGTVTITGNATAATAAAVINSGSTTLTINGTCQSSATAPAIASGVASQVTRLSGPFLLGASGNINPVQAQSWRFAPTQIPTYYEVATSGGTTKRNLFSSDNIPTSNYPAPANVRSGTVYGPNQENTGTLAVPAAGNVALGVPVDNTTGAAVLTSANVQTALGAFSSGRLNNVATVDSTGAQIQAAVSQ